MDYTIRLSAPLDVLGPTTILIPRIPDTSDSAQRTYLTFLLLNFKFCILQLNFKFCMKKLTFGHRYRKHISITGRYRPFLQKHFLCNQFITWLNV